MSRSQDGDEAVSTTPSTYAAVHVSAMSWEIGAEKTTDALILWLGVACRRCSTAQVLPKRAIGRLLETTTAFHTMSNAKNASTYFAAQRMEFGFLAADK